MRSVERIALEMEEIMKASKDNFFKPGRVSTQTKAHTTDTASKEILAAEAAQRAKKTERLRLMRLAQTDAAAAKKS